LDIISGHVGDGGIAVNADGTLVASVDRAHCVYIYNVADRTSDHPVVVGIAGTSGSAHGLLKCPTGVCFVHRDGVDTLLISDYGNDRVVEVTVRGEFMRAIAVSRPWGIAVRDGVIAVSLHFAHAVVLLQYESGAVKPEVTIGSGTAGDADGQLCYPAGVAFTTDGRYVLVADSWNDRVSKFSVASGSFVAHVISNGITYPRDVLQCADGRIVVVYRKGVVCVGKAGAMVQNITFSSGGDPRSLSYSPSLNGVLVKRDDGNVLVLRDAWSHSLRCAWVQACVRV
jgi:DNA-binding beta-propeller fold protein YncE